MAVSGVCKYDTITLVPRVSPRVSPRPGHVRSRAWRVMSQRGARVVRIARVAAEIIADKYYPVDNSFPKVDQGKDNR